MIGENVVLRAVRRAILAVAIVLFSTATSYAFIWSITKTPEGALSARGNSPSANFVAFLADNAGTEINDSATVTSGAPKGFSTAALAGINALGKLNYGRVYFDGSEWTLAGHALTLADRDNAQTTLTTYGQDLASWNIIISADEPVSVPVAENSAEADEVSTATDLYLWSIVKSDNGSLSVSGSSPNASFVAFLATNAGQAIEDNSLPKTGAPKGFPIAALAGTTALSNLQNGSAYFDGLEWTLTGHVTTPENRESAQGALTTFGQDIANWNIIITAPKPDPAPEPMPEPASEPAAEMDTAKPYLWRIEKSDNGIRTISGYTPSIALQVELAGAMGGGVNDKSSLAKGEPSGFEIDAFAAIWALAALEKGAAEFDGAIWSLKGQAPNIKTLERTGAQIVLNALEAQNWTIEIRVSVAQCQVGISTIIAENAIVFGSGSAQITKTSLATLDHVAATLNACPTSDVFVEGHTDSDGPEAANMDLSVRRAIAVSEYLDNQNVAPERMTAVGYGESSPIIPNDTRAEKAQNRRIVFQIQNQTN